jgi:ABC-type Fe2+-enterobactin transport system substrate-binding protein
MAEVTVAFGADIVEIEMTARQAAHYLAGNAMTVTAEDGEPVIRRTASSACGTERMPRDKPSRILSTRSAVTLTLRLTKTPGAAVAASSRQPRGYLTLIPE